MDGNKNPTRRQDARIRTRQLARRARSRSRSPVAAGTPPPRSRSRSPVGDADPETPPPNYEDVHWGTHPVRRRAQFIIYRHDSRHMNDWCTFCLFHGSCERFELYVRTGDEEVFVACFFLHTSGSERRHRGRGDPCGVAFANSLFHFDVLWDGEWEGESTIDDWLRTRFLSLRDPENNLRTRFPSPRDPEDSEDFI